MSQVLHLKKKSKCSLNNFGRQQRQYVVWLGGQGGVFFLPYVSLKSPESISKSFINYSPKASGKLVSFSTMDSKKSMTEDMVLKITEDKNGFIWLGTRNNGVFRFDGKTFTNINKLNGLPNNNVSTIYEDKDGNMWFGCDIPDGVTKGGIARLDKKLLNSANKKITEMPTRKGLPNSRSEQYCKTKKAICGLVQEEVAS